MLLNVLMFWIMCLEALVCLLITIPYGKYFAQTTVQFLSPLIGGKNSLVSTVVNIVLSLIAILFFSNVHTCWQYQSSDEYLSDGLRLRLLEAQRDLYITGFSLFLFLLLRLVYSSIETNIKLEKSLGAMKKQAEGASTGYKKLFEENELQQKQLQKVLELCGLTEEELSSDSKNAGDSKVDLVQRLLEENAKAAQTIEAKEKEYKELVKEKQQLAMQAENQSQAFVSLIQENQEQEADLKSMKEFYEKHKNFEDEVKELRATNASLKAQLQEMDEKATATKKNE